MRHATNDRGSRRITVPHNKTLKDTRVGKGGDPTTPRTSGSRMGLGLGRESSTVLLPRSAERAAQATLLIKIYTLRDAD